MVWLAGNRATQCRKNGRDCRRYAIERLPEALKYIEGYAADAMDIQHDLSEKMKALSEDEFEGLLRPAFKQDEWILITVGAVLGALVGEMQVQIMLKFGGLG